MKEILKNGFLPGIIATFCCLGPLLLIMLGVISASAALSVIAVSNRYFIPLGVIVFTLMIWFTLKKRRQIICNGCNDKGQERKRILTFILSSIAVSVVTYLVVYYTVVPVLAPFVLDNFYKR